MANIAQNLVSLIGKTPLIRLSRFAPEVSCELLGKIEAFNPGASVKDRIAFAMIEAAEKEGKLKPGATIIEPTSGNTGIGLAWVAAVKGYRIILLMPESMSIERRKILQGLGAELVLTPAQEGMEGAIDQAQVLSEQIPDAYMPQQFKNPANPRIHYTSTGPEIWDDCDGRVDALVAGVGTGGTISGAGKFLKEKNPDCRIIAVEPEESAVISGQDAGPHMIQGIGAGFIPEILDTGIIDETITIHSTKAIEAAKIITRKEGLMVGISSGANVFAALQVAQRKEFADKRIVAILPDTGERYLSTLLYYED
ncbi:MAG: cysteine synthase A [Chitinivibrionales bacterium]|nr:cysteine synthase A [Chitinivibrionales bacterium]